MLAYALGEQRYVLGLPLQLLTVHILGVVVLPQL